MNNGPFEIKSSAYENGRGQRPCLYEEKKNKVINIQSIVGGHSSLQRRLKHLLKMYSLEQAVNNKNLHSLSDWLNTLTVFSPLANKLHL